MHKLCPLSAPNEYTQRLAQLATVSLSLAFEGVDRRRQLPGFTTVQAVCVSVFKAPFFFGELPLALSTTLYTPRFGFFLLCSSTALQCSLHTHECDTLQFGVHSTATDRHWSSSQTAPPPNG